MPSQAISSKYGAALAIAVNEFDKEGGTDLHKEATATIVGIRNEIHAALAEVVISRPVWKADKIAERITEEYKGTLWKCGTAEQYFCNDAVCPSYALPTFKSLFRCLVSTEEEHPGYQTVCDIMVRAMKRTLGDRIKYTHTHLAEAQNIMCENE
jgi:hypothetical protein